MDGISVTTFADPRLAATLARMTHAPVTVGRAEDGELVRWCLARETPERARQIIDSLMGKSAAVAVPHAGLVPVKRTASRGGRVYVQTRWMSPEDARQGSPSARLEEGSAKYADLGRFERNRLVSEIDPVVRGEVRSAAARRSVLREKEDDAVAHVYVHIAGALPAYSPTAGTLRGYVREIARRKVGEFADLHAGGRGKLGAHTGRVMRRVAAVEDRLARELGRTPSDAEVWRETKFTRADLGFSGSSRGDALKDEDTITSDGRTIRGGVSIVREMRARMHAERGVVSLDTPRESEDGEGATLADVLPSGGPSPEEVAIQRQRVAQKRALIEDALSRIRPDIVEILRLRYGLTDRGSAMEASDLAEHMASTQGGTVREWRRRVNSAETTLRHHLKKDRRIELLLREFDEAPDPGRKSARIVVRRR